MSFKIPWGSGSKPSQDKKDVSLDDILPQQTHRVELLLLVVLCTDTMRSTLDQAFETRYQALKPPAKASKDDLLALDDADEVKLDRGVKRDTSYNNLDPSASSRELVSLKSAATSYFNTWRTSILRRLGEKLKVSPTAVKRAKENYMTGLEAEFRARKHFDGFDLLSDEEQHESTSTDSSALQSPTLLTPSSSTSTLTATNAEILTPRTALSRQTSSQSQPQLSQSASPVASSPQLPSKIHTKLNTLTSQTRGLILNATLFILLSLEHYPSYSRILLAKLAHHLDLPSDVLISAEANLALTLQQSTTSLPESSSVSSPSNQSISQPQPQRAPSDSSSISSNSRWKIGLATVAGAALVGVTGGLAAPFLLGAAGAIMGGVGLGGLAGLLGATIANPVTVAALFGVLGGRMSGKAMAEFEKEVEDFEVVDVRDEIGRSQNEEGSGHKEVKKEEVLWDGDQERDGDRFFRNSLDEERSRTETGTCSRVNSSTPAASSKAVSTVTPKTPPHLRLVLGISGWVLQPQDIVRPWRVFLPSHFTPHALRYEQSSLLKLSESMDKVLQQSAYSLAQAGALQLALPAISAALLPLSLLSVGTGWLDNPFSIAMERSDKAGRVLARALIGRLLQGERPIILIGFSLGARVIYSCLMEMVRISTSLNGGSGKGRGGNGLVMSGSGGFGIVEHVVLIGAPIPSDELVWRKIRAVTAGRVVNVYTTSDLLLGYLYRVRYAQMGVAGLEPIHQGVKSVESYDVTGLVKGHAQYRLAIGKILRDVVRFEGLDMEEVDKEEEELEREDQREKSVHDAAKREGKLDGQEDEDGKIVMVDNSVNTDSDVDAHAALAASTTTAIVESDQAGDRTTGAHRVSVKGKSHAGNEGGANIKDEKTVKHAIGDAEYGVDNDDGNNNMDESEISGNQHDRHTHDAAASSAMEAVIPIHSRKRRTSGKRTNIADPHIGTGTETFTEVSSDPAADDASADVQRNQSVVQVNVGSKGSGWNNSGWASRRSPGTVKGNSIHGADDHDDYDHYHIQSQSHSGYQPPDQYQDHKPPRSTHNPQRLQGQKTPRAIEPNSTVTTQNSQDRKDDSSKSKSGNENRKHDPEIEVESEQGPKSQTQYQSQSQDDAVTDSDDETPHTDEDDHEEDEMHEMISLDPEPETTP